MVPQRGGARLTRKPGYPFTYVRQGKPRASGLQLWRCSTRACGASVSQRDDEFSEGAKPHTCTPHAGCDKVTEVFSSQTKRAYDTRFCL